jgi:tRNA(fMet)-specific endonuclease VapC
MARYILDTGIIVGYLRWAEYAKFVKKEYSPLTPPNVPAISIVTHAELRSLALQWRWGDKKRQALDELLRKIPQIDINEEAILQQYAEIDAFSQGKHPEKNLPPKLAARNMGKNDVWIAATTSTLNATLITTDSDFAHLHGVFLPVIYIDPKTKP